MTDALSNWLVIAAGSGSNFPSSKNSLFSFSLRFRAAFLLLSFILSLSLISCLFDTTIVIYFHMYLEVLLKNILFTQLIRKRIIFYTQMSLEIQQQENNVISSTITIMITRFIMAILIKDYYFSSKNHWYFKIQIYFIQRTIVLLITIYTEIKC